MVSNRIYDVLACGTPVVSDAMVEIEEQFEDVVPMYSDPGGSRRRWWSSCNRIRPAPSVWPMTGRRVVSVSAHTRPSSEASRRPARRSRAAAVALTSVGLELPEWRRSAASSNGAAVRSLGCDRGRGAARHPGSTARRSGPARPQETIDAHDLPDVRGRGRRLRDRHAPQWDVTRRPLARVPRRVAGNARRAAACRVPTTPPVTGRTRRSRSSTTSCSRRLGGSWDEPPVLPSGWECEPRSRRPPRPRHETRSRPRSAIGGRLRSWSGSRTRGSRSCCPSGAP